MPNFLDWDDEELLDGLILTAQESADHLSRGLLPEHESLEAEVEVLRREFLRRLTLVR
jgi:hypothetical protein